MDCLAGGVGSKPHPITRTSAWCMNSEMKVIDNIRRSTYIKNQSNRLIKEVEPMHKLDFDGYDSYRVNYKKEFICNGILTLENISECFDFAYGMTFGGMGAHRNHRSGGQMRRHLGEVFINTFQGKLAEFALYNYLTRVGRINLDAPDMNMMELTRWDSFDLYIEGLTINVKSTKRRGNLLLLETKDWDFEGRYIPNKYSGCDMYDYFVFVRVDPDGEGIMREKGLLHTDSADIKILREIILSERWRVNLAGYITGEELIDEVIEPGHILPQNSTLNRYTHMDAENYYVQAGDMHEIDGLLKEICDRRGDDERRYWQA